MADKDHAQKFIFSHAEMIRDLLIGFVREPWVARLDFDTLERVNSSFVSDDLRDREDDIIWRVRWRGEWLYVYLLLEFQSTVDPWMALRILVYVGLLYQDLIRSGVVSAGMKLPPVLPVVLYNGERQWTAVEDVANLIIEMPEGLEQYRPHLRYFILEESGYSDEELRQLNTAVAGMFRLENSWTPEIAGQAIGTMMEWASAPERDSLRRAILVWLERVWLPSRLPGVDLPPVRDLEEVKRMLDERTRDWTKRWRQEGEAALLTRLMDRRFGPLDEETRQRIASADTNTLLEWADRVLTARHIGEVITEPI